MAKRLVISVCPRELGVVVLPLERGARGSRLDARTIVAQIPALAARLGVADRVRVREACAGGCSGSGPNVSVTLYPIPAAGERDDQVAVGWKTYVYSLPSLDCLARIIAENLDEPPAAPRRRRGRSAPR